MLNKKYFFVLAPIVLGTIFCLAGVGAFCGIFFTQAYPKIQVRNSYHRAVCSVVAYDPVTTVGCQTQRCPLRYQATISVLIGGQIAHMNKRIDYDWPTPRAAQDWQSLYAIGSAVNCYYNGQATAVAERDLHSVNFVGPVVIACLVGAGLILFGCLVAVFGSLLVAGIIYNDIHDMTGIPSFQQQQKHLEEGGLTSVHF